MSGGRRNARFGSRSWGILLILSAAVLFATAAPSRAATYYVDGNAGNDSHPGTSQQPWKTIDKVQTTSSPGDTIIVLAWTDVLSKSRWPSGRSYLGKTVYQHGITWTFNKEYRIGQFANGDYWVVGPITLTAISPSGATQNGSMINPTSNSAQGFDSRSNYWNASTNVATSVPMTIPVGSSLISTRSLSEASSASYVGYAAVLTVLASAPSEGAFRPPYFGTDKTVRYNSSQLKYNLLRNLTPTASAPTLATVETYFAGPWIDFGAGWSGRTFHPAHQMPPYGRDLSARIGTGALALNLKYTNQQKETLMIRFTQLGIDLHGIASHPNGRKTWAADGGHCMGRKYPILFAGTVLGSSTLLDVANKSGAYLWSAKPGGGFYGPGNAPPDYIYFQEDAQTFFVDQFMVDLTLKTSVSGPSLGATSTTITIDNLPKWYGNPSHQYIEITSGPGAGQKRYITGSNYNRSVGGVTTVTVTPAWTTTPVTGSSYYRCRGYEASQIGMAEWGVRHADTPADSNPSWGADYRITANIAFPGWILAARIMNLEDIWNHEALFAWMDRWMTANQPDGDFPRDDRGSWEGWQADMWVAYRGNVGSSKPGNDDDEPAEQDGDGDGGSAAPQITAIGGRAVSSGTSLRFDVAENETITLAVDATDTDGDPITYSASGLPSGASFSGQTFSWTPTYNQAGTYQVTFIADDGRSQDSKTITITVANVNRAPTLSQIGDRSIDENRSLTFSVSASDPDADPITYSATGLPSGANFAGGSFSWTPSSSQVGSHSITFVASDGNSQNSETVTIFVAATSSDGTAPVVARRSPEPDAIQVSLNNLVTLHVTDEGRGVDAESVVIRVDDHVVYQGDTNVYQSAFGQCSRSGTPNDYRYIYQANRAFDFDHTVVVKVSAADRAGNAMSVQSYSFTTEMRAFGSNRTVSAGAGISGAKSSPATVSDPAGTIWAVWCSGAEGSRNIYASRIPADSGIPAAPVAVTTAAGDQCHPDIARDRDGMLYVTWQDKQRGNWDIFVATSPDGITWSRPIQVTDSDHNETHPAIAADSRSPSRVYIVWQDDREGHADIYAMSSANAFADTLSSRLTTDAADQITPDVAIGAEDTAYVVWTDMRNGQADIYGARSGAPGWTNIPIVATSSEQTSPVIAIDQDSWMLHLLWVDDAPGDADIYYATLEGLPDSPVTGASIIDDTSGADQRDPALVCAGESRVFACWQDYRHSRQRTGDTDLFLAELGPASAGTNIFVGDDGTNSGQREPAMGLDAYGNPYIVWTDGRGPHAEIYYAATTFVDPIPLDAKQVTASTGVTVGVDPAAIDGPDDVSIVVPIGACRSDVRISISRIVNPPVAPAECLGSYDFGPSGIDFDVPVTVTIPYRFNGTGNAARPFWYDSLTGALSQQGITDIENIVISSNLNALRFKTTHFTPFYLVASDAESIEDADTDGGGGGGGCSVSSTGEGTARELIVPYALIAAAMMVLRRRDRRRRLSTEALQG